MIVQVALGLGDGIGVEVKDGGGERRGGTRTRQHAAEVLRVAGATTGDHGHIHGRHHCGGQIEASLRKVLKV